MTRGFIGLGEAGYGPAAGAILSSVFPTRMRATIIGWRPRVGGIGSSNGRSQPRSATVNPQNAGQSCQTEINPSQGRKFFEAISEAARHVWPNADNHSLPFRGNQSPRWIELRLLGADRKPADSTQRAFFQLLPAAADWGRGVSSWCLWARPMQPTRQIWRPTAAQTFFEGEEG